MKLIEKVFDDWSVMLADNSISKESKTEIIRMLEDYEKYHLEFASEISKILEKLK